VLNEKHGKKKSIYVSESERARVAEEREEWKEKRFSP
jgi:hypothetical protein